MRIVINYREKKKYYSKRKLYLNRRIIEIKQNSDSKRREEAAKTLGGFEYERVERKIRHKVLATLKIYLSNTFEDEAYVRIAVAEALGKIPYWSPEDDKRVRFVKTALRHANLFDPNDDVKYKARWALEKLKHYTIE